MIYDYLIVGQGLAGSLMAYQLQRANQQIYVIDPNHTKASSQIAAGLVNPITGRHFVKSWRVDELIPYAKQFYAQMSRDLGVSIFNDYKLCMLLSSPKMENNWMQRSAEPEVKGYLVSEAEIDQESYKQVYREIRCVLEFSPAGRVDMKNLIETFQNKLKRENRYSSTYFDYTQLKCGRILEYKTIRAWNIIFCEGYQAIHNPFFNYLPFKPSKGEVLFVRIPNYALKQRLVKHKVFVIHWKDDLYWIGSSYNRNYQHEQPTAQEKQELLNKLQRILRLPFELVSHRAAVRPTVSDHRPFLGTHPHLKQLHIFNGLGAKGSYLGPFFARQMTRFLVEGNLLEKEVNIKRYLFSWKRMSS